MSRKLKIDNVLPLKHFIRQQGVVKLYKDFLRACRGVVPPDARRELEMQIKFEFRRNKVISDVIVIKSLMTEGRRSLKIVQAMGAKASNQDKVGFCIHSFHRSIFDVCIR